MIMIIGISAAAVAVLAVGFFLWKKQKERIQTCQRFLDGAIENCRSMMTLGNLSSGFYEREIKPIEDNLMSYQEDLNNGKIKSVKATDALLNFIAQCNSQVATAQAKVSHTTKTPAKTATPKNAPEPYITYYPNGKVKEEAYTLNGKFHGEYKVYTENNTLFQIGSFNNGVREGKSTTYHPNGNLRQESNYLNNQVHGETKSYDENGTLTEIGNFSTFNYELR
jgi:antitoxin component YwqK of YwqJK toxin-antitoxin module